MLEVLFTQDSKVEDLFCGASSGSEPSLFFSNYFFSLGFKPIQDDFQHDFTRMTDEADSSVVLAKLQFALCLSLEKINVASIGFFQRVCIHLFVCACGGGGGGGG